MCAKLATRKQCAPSRPHIYNKAHYRRGVMRLFFVFVFISEKRITGQTRMKRLFPHWLNCARKLRRQSGIKTLRRRAVCALW